MISDTVSSSELSPHQSRARIDCEVGIQTHDPAVGAQIIPRTLEPRAERITWAQPIDLDIMARPRQLERRTYWHPIVNVTPLPPGDLQPRLPPEIHDLIIHFMGPESDFRQDLYANTSWVEYDAQEDSIQMLSTCCRVCRRWVPLCQRLLFYWVVLRNSAQLDSLFHLHRTSRISHLSPLIRRITVRYDEPEDKLGEALPRIATMAPSNLVRIDIVGSRSGYAFPFQDSFSKLLTPLHYVRILHSLFLEFTNFSEFRQLISCFRGLHTLYFSGFWGEVSEIPRALHQTAHPFLTRIATCPIENVLWPWLSPRGSGAGRQPRCSTAQTCRSVPSVSVAFAAFMRTITQWVSNTVDAEKDDLYVEWKWEKCARSVGQSQWLLHLRHDDIGFTALVKFQAHTDFPRPSFDPSHIVELRTTIPLRMDVDDDDLDTLFSVWKHDQLGHLENLERLEIGIQIDVNRSFRTSMDLLEHLAWQQEPDPNIINRLERGFEPLLECDRQFELEIAVCGFPFDDVLRGWKETMATMESEGSGEDMEEYTDSGEGSDDTDSEEGSDEDLTDFECEVYTS
ncbi:hypothetical protein NLI96_g6965 [Meripilus lineatus]|uniref:F-box domain-containing protein n=1 Tax=Meripilus lineatus TaxID=2056292 RepID=A0AAD5YFG2_9APHY|nr:hypothetical protein NLI96_g6965 [Physisporinus lineatus]